MKENEKELFLPNIALCIFLDLVGMASYIFPALGEFADIVWAPISGYVSLKSSNVARMPAQNLS